MVFVRYVRKPPPTQDVCLTCKLILFSSRGWQKAGLVGTEYVNLYWDDKSQRIGMSSTDADDPSAFQVVASEQGITIGAKKFFTTFRLQGTQVAGNIHDTGQVVAFKVRLPEGASQQVNGEVIKRRRGRPKKTPIE